MANEWTPVELYGLNNDGNPRSYTISDGVAVSKGAVLSLLAGRIASAALATDLSFAGVASEDHKAGVGVTRISAWTDGVFNATASGAIEKGAGVFGVESNKIRSGALSVYGYIGYVLDTFANGDTKNVRLQL